MIDTKLIQVAGSVAVVALLIVPAWLAAARRHRLEKQRLEVLAEALQHPTLDAATRAELLRALARDHVEAAKPWGVRFARQLAMAWFAASWTAFLVAGGVLLASRVRLLHGVNEQVVLPVALVGFAMLSLPMAWREVWSRGRAVPAPR